MAKVLVIDDETLLADMFRAMLGKLGHEVTTAANGQDGLDKFQRVCPDLVLLDFKMPGHDGIQVLQEIKAMAPATPTIMLSAWASDAVENQARESGVREFLRKGLSLDVILDRINRILVPSSPGKAPAQAAPKAVSAPSTTSSTAAGHIWVVDDEPLIGDMIRRYFEKRGHQVSHAVDMEATMALVMQKTPDVIILDMYFPGTLGLEVLKMLRSRGCHAPIIVLSASQDDRLLQACLEAGVLDIMPKPVNFERLETAIGIAMIWGASESASKQ
jgi:DNA-binding response OmpR family regulator